MAAESADQRERQEFRNLLWTLAQRAAQMLAAVGVGVFLGYQQWGDAGELRRQVEDLQARVALREKERDTVKSQMALVDRDRKELEKRLQDLQARCGTGETP